ncbi:hypothetical protein ACHAXT_006061 [Thalassiosira profunda]
MEMTKKPPARTSQQPPPAPFTSAAEREDLERALLSSTTESEASQQSYVPTAVPIVAEVFDENGAPSYAASVTASLPPPPPRNAVAASTASKAEKSTKKEYEDDDVIVRPEPPSYNASDALPSAPVLPTHASGLPSTKQRTDQSLLRAANVKGRISAEEEDAAVARAQRGLGQMQHKAGVEVKVANAKAARKVWQSDEGLTVDEGIHHLNLGANGTANKGCKKKEEDEDVRPYKQADGKPGYETSEYETKEYETSEYGVSEYKSVYD